MSLLLLSYNFISVSKLTRTLNCSISFSLDYCLIQDLSTKRIIGKGSESRGSLLLELEVPAPIACFGVVIPFELHCLLGHSSRSVKEAISFVF